MPFSIFKNPFEKAKKRKTDDAKLVGALLGEEEEREMREAMGDQPIEEEIKGDDTIRLSEEEEAAKREVEEEEKEVTPEQRREEYLEWAEEFGKNKDWVDAIFTFNDDGSVEVEDSLTIKNSNITRLPNGLKRVAIDLNLWGCKELTSLEHLPTSVGRDLKLGGCTGLTSLESLQTTSIGGDLYLTSIKVKEIPEGIIVGARVLMYKSQKELLSDVKSKGYKVKTD